MKDWEAADLAEALHFLNRFAETMPRGSHVFLPGISHIQVLHRGLGGWVSLLFYGYSEQDAHELAHLLLLHDPEVGFRFDADTAFEGIPATDLPGTSGTHAHRIPNDPLGTLSGEIDIEQQDQL